MDPRHLRALAFAGLTLAVHAALFSLYARLVGPDHKAQRSDRAVLSAPGELDLLIAGDSHPRTALVPHLMGDHVANAAVGGEHYLKTWYRLRALVELGDKEVGALLLPLDASSFSSWHAENFAPEYIWGRYVDFFEVGAVRGEPWAYAGRWAKAKLFPYAGELRTLNQIRTRRYGFGDELPGGSFGARSLRDRIALSRSHARDHFRDVELIDVGLLWAFRQLLGWADAEQIRVVLVSFPVTGSYDRFAQRAGAWERVRDEVLEPILAEGRHLYIDDHDRFLGRDELFSDPHHLNSPGRILYSRILRQRLIGEGILPE